MDKYKIALSNLRLLERKYKFETTNQVAPQVWCDILEELVEKATPKKVIKREIERTKEAIELYIDLYDEYPTPTVEMYLCPNCETHFIYMGENYCSECGQRISWE